MDLDAFTAVNQQDWDRLRTLSKRRRLSSAEIDELVELYGRASTHLSVVQAQDPDGPHASGLSLVVAAARTRLTSATENPGSVVREFVSRQLPAAFYRIRWMTVILGVLFCAVGTAYATWVATSPEVLASLMTPEEQEAFVQEDFVQYYSENPAGSFASLVWTNNAWIAAQEVAFGITGFFVPYVLYTNAQSIGMSAGVMAAHDELDTFFLFILPHGFMELTAIFIAGAAGLQIFWALVAPGRQTRMASVGSAGRSLITVAIGLVGVLFVSALVEAFVTPADWPDPVRLGIGAAVLAGYWVYTLLLGRRAVRDGVTGDLSRTDSGAHQLTA
ncbi:stage II sporulation protein M [Citricoccus muralis]|uniref:Stage II sporulation protein M n=1 Tax=Citricoccus muralis TaxID=169134 RepID=A0ABY8H912_9MICC|nr:stage II sporulation protein M [Citricoccus muralis]WFP17396.1 stage II sporulation protein M [Citricoccus muralis]